ncbi:MAG: hypothetical protein OXR03_14630 [Rhodospirillaceae bacterium]|nr:hypothetical protein [Rhodospirillaceae bacterium]MDD9927056.1 hypothetical protein [Rhodospirillaceae bacterium]
MSVRKGYRFRDKHGLIWIVHDFLEESEKEWAVLVHPAEGEIEVITRDLIRPEWTRVN